VFGSLRKQADADRFQNEFGNGSRVLERTGIERRRPAKDLDGKDSLLFSRHSFERLQYLGRLFAPALRLIFRDLSPTNLEAR
jgi:hypothetical protein